MLGKNFRNFFFSHLTSQREHRRKFFTRGFLAYLLKRVFTAAARSHPHCEALTAWAVGLDPNTEEVSQAHCVSNHLPLAQLVRPSLDPASDCPAGRSKVDGCRHVSRQGRSARYRYVWFVRVGPADGRFRGVHGRLFRSVAALIPQFLVQFPNSGIGDLHSKELALAWTDWLMCPFLGRGHGLPHLIRQGHTRKADLSPLSPA